MYDQFGVYHTTPKTQPRVRVTLPTQPTKHPECSNQRYCKFSRAFLTCEEYLDAMETADTKFYG